MAKLLSYRLHYRENRIEMVVDFDVDTEKEAVTRALTFLGERDREGLCLSLICLQPIMNASGFAVKRNQQAA